MNIHKQSKFHLNIRRDRIVPFTRRPLFVLSLSLRVSFHLFFGWFTDMNSENKEPIEAKFLTPDQILNKVFPDNREPLPALWMFYRRSNKFPIVIIEKACLLTSTDCKDDEKRQLGARNGRNCLHLVHTYFGSCIESYAYEGRLIARWFDDFASPIIDHFA